MLSSRIKRLRTTHQLSQVELASALNVSKQSVSNWENDNILPSVEMLIRIAKFFDVSTDALLGLGCANVISVDGLTDVQTDHIKLLIEDLRKRNDPTL